MTCTNQQTEDCCASQPGPTTRSSNRNKAGGLENMRYPLDDYLQNLDSQIDMTQPLKAPASPALSSETLEVLENAEKLVKSAQKQIMEVSIEASLDTALENSMGRADDSLLHLREIVESKFQESNSDSGKVQQQRITLKDQNHLNHKSCNVQIPFQDPKETVNKKLETFAQKTLQHDEKPFLEKSLNRFNKTSSRPSHFDVLPVQMHNVAAQRQRPPSNRQNRRLISNTGVFEVNSREERTKAKFHVQKGPALDIQRALTIQNVENVHISPDPSYVPICNNVATFSVQYQPSKNSIPSVNSVNYGRGSSSEKIGEKRFTEREIQPPSCGGKNRNVSPDDDSAVTKGTRYIRGLNTGKHEEMRILEKEKERENSDSGKNGKIESDDADTTAKNSKDQQAGTTLDKIGLSSETLHLDKLQEEHLKRGSAHDTAACETKVKRVKMMAEKQVKFLARNEVQKFAGERGQWLNIDSGDASFRKISSIPEGDQFRETAEKQERRSLEYDGNCERGVRSKDCNRDIRVVKFRQEKNLPETDATKKNIQLPRADLSSCEVSARRTLEKELLPGDAVGEAQETDRFGRALEELCSLSQCPTVPIADKERLKQLVEQFFPQAVNRELSDRADRTKSLKDKIHQLLGLRVSTEPGSFEEAINHFVDGFYPDNRRFDLASGLCSLISSLEGITNETKNAKLNETTTDDGIVRGNEDNHKSFEDRFYETRTVGSKNVKVKRSETDEKCKNTYRHKSGGTNDINKNLGKEGKVVTHRTSDHLERETGEKTVQSQSKHAKRDAATPNFDTIIEEQNLPIPADSAKDQTTLNLMNISQGSEDSPSHSETVVSDQGVTNDELFHLHLNPPSLTDLDRVLKVYSKSIDRIVQGTDKLSELLSQHAIFDGPDSQARRAPSPKLQLQNRNRHSTECEFSYDRNDTEPLRSDKSERKERSKKQALQGSILEHRVVEHERHSDEMDAHDETRDEKSEECAGKGKSFNNTNKFLPSKVSQSQVGSASLSKPKCGRADTMNKSAKASTRIVFPSSTAKLQLHKGNQQSTECDFSCDYNDAGPSRSKESEKEEPTIHGLKHKNREKPNGEGNVDDATSHCQKREEKRSDQSTAIVKNTINFPTILSDSTQNALDSKLHSAPTQSGISNFLVKRAELENELNDDSEPRGVLRNRDEAELKVTSVGMQEKREKRLYATASFQEEDSKSDSGFRNPLNVCLNLETAYGRNMERNIGSSVDLHGNESTGFDPCKYLVLASGQKIGSRSTNEDLETQSTTVEDLECQMFGQVLESLKHSSTAMRRFVNWLFEERELKAADETIEDLRKVAVNSASMDQFLTNSRERNERSDVRTGDFPSSESRPSLCDWQKIHDVALFVKDLVRRKNGIRAEADAGTHHIDSVLDTEKSIVNVIENKENGAHFKVDNVASNVHGKIVGKLDFESEFENRKGDESNSVGDRRHFGETFRCNAFNEKWEPLHGKLEDVEAEKNIRQKKCPDDDSLNLDRKAEERREAIEESEFARNVAATKEQRNGQKSTIKCSQRNCPCSVAKRNNDKEIGEGDKSVRNNVNAFAETDSLSQKLTSREDNIRNSNTKSASSSVDKDSEAFVETNREANSKGPASVPDKAKPVQDIGELQIVEQFSDCHESSLTTLKEKCDGKKTSNLSNTEGQERLSKEISVEELYSGIESDLSNASKNPGEIYRCNELEIVQKVVPDLSILYAAEKKDLHSRTVSSAKGRIGALQTGEAHSTRDKPLLTELEEKCDGNEKSNASNTKDQKRLTKEISMGEIHSGTESDLSNASKNPSEKSRPEIVQKVVPDLSILYAAENEDSCHGLLSSRNGRLEAATSNLQSGNIDVWLQNSSYRSISPTLTANNKPIIENKVSDTRNLMSTGANATNKSARGVEEANRNIETTCGGVNDDEINEPKGLRLCASCNTAVDEFSYTEHFGRATYGKLRSSKGIEGSEESPEKKPNGSSIEPVEDTKESREKPESAEASEIRKLVEKLERMDRHSLRVKSRRIDGTREFPEEKLNCSLFKSLEDPTKSPEKPHSPESPQSRKPVEQPERLDQDSVSTVPTVGKLLVTDSIVAMKTLNKEEHTCFIAKPSFEVRKLIEKKSREVSALQIQKPTRLDKSEKTGDAVCGRSEEVREKTERVESNKGHLTPSDEESADVDSELFRLKECTDDDDHAEFCRRKELRSGNFQTLEEAVCCNQSDERSSESIESSDSEPGQFSQGRILFHKALEVSSAKLGESCNVDGMQNRGIKNDRTLDGLDSQARSSFGVPNFASTARECSYKREYTARNRKHSRETHGKSKIKMKIKLPDGKRQDSFAAVEDFEESRPQIIDRFLDKRNLEDANIDCVFKNDLGRPRVVNKQRCSSKSECRQFPIKLNQVVNTMSTTGRSDILDNLELCTDNRSAERYLAQRGCTDQCRSPRRQWLNRDETPSETCSEGEIRLLSSDSYSLGERRVPGQGDSIVGKSFRGANGVNVYVTRSVLSSETDTSNSLAQSFGEVHGTEVDFTTNSATIGSDGELDVERGGYKLHKVT